MRPNINRLEDTAVEAGVPTERFWRLTFPEVERELKAVNQRREFFTAQAANVANFAFSDEVATLNKFLGREKDPEQTGWAEKAYMYFDAASRLDDEDMGS